MLEQIQKLRDAEGSIDNGPTIRVSNTDDTLLLKYCDGLKLFNFNYKTEAYKTKVKTIRIKGDLREKIRFISTFTPSITRKKDKLLGHRVRSKETIKSITEKNEGALASRQFA